jgi:DNA repair exonuclease SbcCD nuclease subunit
MLRWLAFSDIHLKHVNDPKRVGDVERLFTELIAVVKSRNVKLVAFLGDWYNSKAFLHAALCNYSLEKVEELSKLAELLFVVGNHDQIFVDKKESTLRPFSRFGHVFEEPGQFSHPDMTFSCLPFTRNVEEIRTFCAKPANVLLGHIELDGLRASKSWTMKSSIIREDLGQNHKLILTGHIHWPQTIGNVICIGSPLEHDFSDAGSNPRGFFIFDGVDLTEFYALSDYPKHFILDYPSPLPEGDNYVRVIGVPREDVQKVLHEASTKGIREISVIPKVEKVDSTPDRVHTIDTALREYVEKNADDSFEKGELVDLGISYLRTR